MGGCLRRIVGIVIMLGILLVVGITALGYLQSHEHCTVGLTGQTVSITIDGPSANYQCDSFVGVTTNGASWYTYESGAQPGGAVLCQVNYLGDLFTVRDQGILTIYGHNACQYLAGKANGSPGS